MEPQLVFRTPNGVVLPTATFLQLLEGAPSAQHAEILRAQAAEQRKRIQ